jgi:hypothetical protein
VGVVVFGLFSNQLLDEIPIGAFSFLGAHNGGFEAKAEVYGDTLFKGSRQCLGV